MDEDKSNNNLKSSIASPEDTKKVTPFNCFTASLISAGLAVASYLLTKSVVLTYVNMPIKFNNPMAASIASAVRTLVMGVTSLATFVFIMVTVGLLSLAVKLIIDEKKVTNP